jgi:hypothetical protein
MLRCGSATDVDVIAAIRMATELGLRVRRRLPKRMTGFVYLWYLPKARRARQGPFMYVGGTRKQGHQEYYGSATMAGYERAVREAGVRLIVEVSCGDSAAITAIEAHHLKRLDVAHDPRFFNTSNAAGAGYARDVARAFHSSPKHAAARKRWLAGRLVAGRRAAITRARTAKAFHFALTSSQRHSPVSVQARIKLAALGT